ncbi:MAG: hypothetical protein R2824_15750 [Saprospiraceae bacterium]|nr:hypothetical protein [Lewinella sp.]
MKDEKLEQALKEFDATWSRPGVQEHLRQLSRIALLLIALLIIVWASERLKEMKKSTVQHTETQEE